MSYEELLKRPEWHHKCIQILKRDGHRCQKCGNFGFHPQSYYECDSIFDLNPLLNDFYINGITLSEFIFNEYKTNSGFVSVKGKAYDIDKLDNCSYRTKIIVDPDTFEPYTFSFNKYQTVSFLSKQKLYEIGDDYNINLLCKNYGKGWKKGWDYYNNEININFGKNISNSIDIASAFKFDKKISNKCIFSCWLQNYTGGFWNGWDVIYTSSIIISITYDIFCFTIYLPPFKLINKAFPIDTKGLNIHHKYYVKTQLPWEYDDDALTCLCEDCHKLVHKENNIPIYRSILPTPQIDSYAKLCDRCGGSGYLPQYEHVEGGICFKCWGEGVLIPY